MLGSYGAWSCDLDVSVTTSIAAKGVIAQIELISSSGAGNFWGLP